MRRFLLTSAAWTGEAELLYGDDGCLVRLDLSQTQMPPAFVKSFKDKTPVRVDELPGGFDVTKVTILESDVTIEFGAFWSRYGKKINKARCVPLWSKLSETDKAKAIQGIAQYDRYLKMVDWRSKADPEKYLRDRYWENEWK